MCRIYYSFRIWRKNLLSHDWEVAICNSRLMIDERLPTCWTLCHCWPNISGILKNIPRQTLRNDPQWKELLARNKLNFVFGIMELPFPSYNVAPHSVVCTLTWLNLSNYTEGNYSLLTITTLFKIILVEESLETYNVIAELWHRFFL